MSFEAENWMRVYQLVSFRWKKFSICMEAYLVLKHVQQRMAGEDSAENDCFRTMPNRHSHEIIIHRVWDRIVLSYRSHILP